eukprot:6691137-Prymnesium_polylepis.3
MAPDSIPVRPSRATERSFATASSNRGAKGKQRVIRRSSSSMRETCAAWPSSLCALHARGSLSPWRGLQYSRIARCTG